MEGTKTVFIIGHVAKDVKEGTPASVPDDAVDQLEFVPGGGVFYGALALSQLARPFGLTVHAVTKCNEMDRHYYKEMEEKVSVTEFMSSPTTTTIRNVYIDNDPEKRVGHFLQRAQKWSEADLVIVKTPESGVDLPWCILTPLWGGEFPEELIPILRSRVAVLAADVQGFTRHIDDNGFMEAIPWEGFEKWVHHFDILKIDNKECEILTGSKDYKAGSVTIAQHMHEGACVICTHTLGAVLTIVTGPKYGDVRQTEELFGPYPIEGRTGRGDTVTATFVGARAHGSTPEEALKIAITVTTFKMQTPGPLRSLPATFEA